MSPHFLTTSRLLRQALVSWASVRVGVLRLPYLDVFPFTFLHLPLNFIRVSSLRLMYLHPSVDPSLTFSVIFKAWDWLWYPILLSQRRSRVRMHQNIHTIQYIYTNNMHAYI